MKSEMPKKKVVQASNRKITYNLKENGKADTGRPTKCTEDVITKLEWIFMNDWSVEDACAVVGVSPKNFYERRKNDETFRKRIDSARRYAFILAQQTLVNSMKSDREDIAQKWAIEFMKRRDPRYKDKVESEVEMDVDVDNNITLKDKSMLDLEEIRKGLLGF